MDALRAGHVAAAEILIKKHKVQPSKQYKLFYCFTCKVFLFARHSVTYYSIAEPMIAEKLLCTIADLSLESYLFSYSE